MSRKRSFGGDLKNDAFEVLQGCECVEEDCEEENGCFFPLFDGESRESVAARHRASVRIYEMMETAATKAMKKLSTPTYDSILKFIKSPCESSSFPAAVVQPGVNIQNDENTYEGLIQFLKRSGISHIALLRGSDCRNVEEALSEICGQVMDVTFSTPTKRTRGNATTARGKNKFTAVANLGILSEWYKTHCMGRERQPIVIIFSEIENYADDVFARLLESIK